MIDSEENTNKQRRGYSKGTTVKSVTMAVTSINKNLQEKYQNTITVQYISKDKKLPFTLAFSGVSPSFLQVVTHVILHMHTHHFFSDCTV